MNFGCVVGHEAARPDGRRAWAATDDPDTVAELRSGEEQIGRAVKLAPDGTLRL
jgi:hypothetical protein